MDFVQFTEIGLLIMFGLSWPFNISKSIQARTAKGKSVQFEWLIIIGYCFGLTGKLYTFAHTGHLPYAVWFYFADIVMVSIDVFFYYRNTKLDKLRDEQTEA